MADKRMFAQSIVLSDVFLDMPMSARCLYFTLGMLADDEGFIGNPKSIMRQCGATDDDIKILLAKRYLLTFESGVIVIKHWKINNYLRQDRIHETTYLEEKATLIEDEKGAYTEANKQLGCQVADSCPSNDRLDKNSIDKNRLDKNSIDIPNGISTEWKAYKEMRKKIKSPMTEYAEQLALKKLLKMASDEETQKAIINQSILNNWKGLFPLKDEPKQETKERYEMNL